MNKIELHKNIQFIFSILVFLFGLGIIIFGNTIETKFFGLIYIILSMKWKNNFLVRYSVFL